jgi:hypothetical protein
MVSVASPMLLDRTVAQPFSDGRVMQQLLVATFHPACLDPAKVQMRACINEILGH